MCFVVYISMISQYDELDNPKLFTFQLYRILHVVFPNMSLLLASDETNSDVNQITLSYSLSSCFEVYML